MNGAIFKLCTLAVYKVITHNANWFDICEYIIISICYKTWKQLILLLN